MARLVLLNASGEPVVALALTSEPIFVGRSPVNDLVVHDPSVSGRHLSVWHAGGRVAVEDLGSRNGTFTAEGRRLVGVDSVLETQRLRLGHDLWIEVELDREPERPVGLLVEAVGGPGALAMRGERFWIGPSEDADLRLDVPEEAAVCIVRGESGELHLEGGTQRTTLEIGVVFEVGGQALVLRRASLDAGRTLDTSIAGLNYTLSVRLGAATGATATLADPLTGKQHTVSAENRVMLLVVLARKRLDDLAARLPPDDCGWVADDAVATGVWGRQEGRNKNLNVLMTRVRSELRDAGFDATFLEKRRGFSRLVLNALDL